MSGKSATHEFFFDDVLYLSGRCMQAYNASDLSAPLGGLGIRSDFAVLLDGIPIGGASLYGRHGTVIVVCTCSVSPHTHRLYAQLQTWFVADRGHGGEATATATAAALAAPPLGLSLRELERSMCLVGGDGAVVRGGPGRLKPGTQAGDILWAKAHACVETLGVGVEDWASDPSRLHRCTEWDKFHREDLCASRAIAATPMA